MLPVQRKAVAEIEREIAKFIDDLAHVVADNELSWAEIDYILRMAATSLRQSADKQEEDL